MGLFVVGTLKTGNDGDLEVERLDGVDETGGNVVAADDATENVDKDGSDLGVASDEFESLTDGLGSGTPTDVEEVGGLAAVQLDNVHGGHGKTSTVDEAANVAVKLDKVQAALGSADLVSVFLGRVAHLENILLAEVGVVVKAKLGVHAQDLVVRGLGEGVDLDLGSVLFAEDFVELLDGLLGILDALVAETELGGNVAGHLVGNALVNVDVGGGDGVGALLGDCLNVHAALGGGDDDGSLRGTIHEDGEIELAAGKLALANVNSAAEAAVGAGLLGDELVTNHLLGEHLGLVGRVDDANTTLEAVVKGSLATAASEDLGLDDHVLAANLVGDSLCLLGGVGDGALGNTDTILYLVSLMFRESQRPVVRRGQVFFTFLRRSAERYSWMLRALRC